MKAEDGGTPRLNNTVVVLVRLTDTQGSTPPAWSADSYQVTVPENHNIGFALLNFSATSSRTISGLSFGLVNNLGLFATRLYPGSTGATQAGFLVNTGQLDYETAPLINNNTRVYTLTLQATVSEQLGFFWLSHNKFNITINLFPLLNLGRALKNILIMQRIYIRFSKSLN